MSAKIMYYTNGAWIGGGAIPASLRETKNLSQWISNFLQELKTISQLSPEFANQPLAFSSPDKSQANANLLAELDNLLGALIVFRCYLTKDNPNHFYSLEGPYKYSFYIHVDKVSWGGKGRLGKKYVFNLSTFTDWYNNIVLKNFSKVFNKYAESLANGSITEKERIGLICFIETAIFNILIIERVLLSSTGNS